jgi:hypothetical protein
VERYAPLADKPTDVPDRDAEMIGELLDVDEAAQVRRSRGCGR